MKAYRGTAKVKDTSNYVYAGHTFEVIGLYKETKIMVKGDCSKDYQINIEGTEFQEKFGNQL